MKKLNNLFANASGPHPEQFQLDFYNSLISDPNTTADQLNSAIADVDYYAKEYNRQSVEHANKQPRPDLQNSQIAASWRDTALRVIEELKAKLKTVSNPKNPRNLLDIGSPTLDTTAGANRDKDGNYLDKDGNIIADSTGKPVEDKPFIKKMFYTATGNINWKSVGGAVVIAAGLSWGIYKGIKWYKNRGK